MKTPKLLIKRHKTFCVLAPAHTTDRLTSEYLPSASIIQTIVLPIRFWVFAHTVSPTQDKRPCLWWGKIPTYPAQTTKAPVLDGLLVPSPSALYTPQNSCTISSLCLSWCSAAAFKSSPSLWSLHPWVIQAQFHTVHRHSSLGYLQNKTEPYLCSPSTILELDTWGVDMHQMSNCLWTTAL